MEKANHSHLEVVGHIQTLRDLTQAPNWVMFQLLADLLMRLAQGI